MIGRLGNKMALRVQRRVRRVCCRLCREREMLMLVGLLEGMDRSMSGEGHLGRP